MRIIYHLRRPRLLFWKLRKKIENLFLPNSSTLKIYNRTAMVLEKDFDLMHPVTYNEKICYEKCFWRDPLATKCADKVLARTYVSEKGLASILIPSYGIYSRVEDIALQTIQKPCVVKINNDSGGVFSILDTTSERDIADIKRKLNKMLHKKNYGSKTGEWVYDDIIPAILIEKRINGSSNISPVDYKVYCFSGKAKLIQTVHGRETGEASFGFYDTSGAKLNVTHGNQHPQFVGAEDPSFFTQLANIVNIANTLSAPFAHVRVDLYLVDGNVYFGELTFFSTGGLSSFYPESFEKEMGDCFVLPTSNIYIKKRP